MNSSATMTRNNEPEDVDVHNRSEHPGWAPRSVGWVEVICGSMFSGKSEELIRRLRRAIIAKQRVQIFKPMIDSRSDAEIVSHSEMRLPSISVASSAELMTQLDPRTEVIGVDEAQFFDPGIVEVCQRI